MHRSTTGKMLLLIALLFPLYTPGQQFSDWSVPTNLGSTVNGPAVDGCPAISKDGLSLYFTSGRNGGQMDIYVTQRDSRDDPWGAPVALGPNINDPVASEICPALTPDGHTLFFVSNRSGGCGLQDIYVSHRKNKRDDFAWEPAEHLDCTINSPANDFGPNYFNTEDDTETLYFSSNRSGGMGGNDIYAITKTEDSGWSIPVPVGELNSVSNDQQTAVRRDGLEVILTSNRPGGVGSNDLWVATRASTSLPWEAPVNLGMPVNSAASEARPALSWDGTELYFGSGRQGGFGNDDLYLARRDKLRGGP